VLVDDHEDSSFDAAGKYSFGKRTAFITIIFLGFQWKFQSGEPEREDQRDYKQTQPPLMTELIL
jgi:hypothetical protein